MTCRVGERTFRAGDRITIDGTDGSIYLGALPLAQPHIGGAISKAARLVRRHPHIAVRANAETLDAVATALSLRRRGHRAGPLRAHVLLEERWSRCAA
jgi:pyruvate, orthophosphate dikinase